MKAEVRGNTPPISLQNPSLFTSTTTAAPPPQNSLSGALRGCLGNLDGGCIEKLLLHCASALESNDVTLAQQVMWVLNNVASSLGDTNQRLTSWFLRALVSRASRLCPTPAAMSFGGGGGGGLHQRPRRRLMTVTELAGYVDLIPWHRFGFCAANSAIFSAIQGCPAVHILDFSITHCMQWPTLIDALAKRPGGPPSLRITVPALRPPVPPFLNVASEQVGLRLANFAKSGDVPFEFNVIIEDQSQTMSGDRESCSAFFESLISYLNPSTLNIREDEALVVNCQNWLRYLPDDRKGNRINHVSLRDTFLQVIKGLNPRIVVVVDEDSELSGSSLSSRITTCFNYFWIPFDALGTFLPKDNHQRIEYESDIGQKIEDIIANEGVQRIERLESGPKSSQRMKGGGFVSIPFREETVKEVKCLLDEHAGGWGMKREEDMLVLTWKGHNSVFATAWFPIPTSSLLDDDDDDQHD